MKIKYGADIQTSAITKNLHRLVGQVYALLPTREEGGNWEKPLATINEEFAGMDSLLFDHHEQLFRILCKLEGLNTYTREEDFEEYRRRIFDCISLISSLKGEIENV